MKPWSRGGRLKSARLAFTGTQVAFGPDEKAAVLAFQRLDRDLNAAGVQNSTDIVRNSCLLAFGTAG